MSGRHAAGAADQPVETAPASVLRVVAGDPTPDELAAITALLAAVAAGRTASSPEAAPLRSSASAWTRSARAPRPTITAGEGRWRGFSG
ncbi:acyl-CoA carboxylase subunit epsilon [Frigoribacterium sp. VKM Ac-1396]|uniref:acyl-CoA carboxylase epsilon subunit n=1 Tax=Frigoribacterium sp. VKM Ac-1396 TaxID=2783821 RepID=UPI00188D4B37|nr:acyl-CoA carboxylase subunit epsilon [Frigoribacterium sp. VKM Ac-1396]